VCNKVSTRAAAGTRVTNYLGNFLLPGYPHTVFNLIYFKLILNIPFILLALVLHF